ncbi:hyalin-like [Amphiura filiformis]|uniref:hyalin-like n=1 Tax=Amphiura filiformis TaxID=82378 RepID=UPI003B222E9E
MATCNFHISIGVVGTLPPEIGTCPTNIRETIELGNTLKRVYWSEPEEFDRSENVSLAFRSHRSGDYFVLGRTNVSYVFTDRSVHIGYCNFSITLITVDTTAPEILQCPSDIFKTIEAGLFGSTVTWKEPLVTDASGNTTLLVKTHSSRTFFTIGKTCVTYLFTDPSNNMVTCQFCISIDIVDTNAPTILMCPTPLRMMTDSGVSKIPVFWAEPIANDHSGDVIVNSSHSPGQLFSIGSTQVLYTFTDRSQNQAICQFSVTVEEEETLFGITGSQTSRFIHLPYGGVQWIAIAALVLAVLLSACIILACFCKILRKKKGSVDDEAKCDGMHVPMVAPIAIDDTSSTI